MLVAFQGGRHGGLSRREHVPGRFIEDSSSRLLTRLQGSSLLCQQRKFSPTVSGPGSLIVT